MSSILFSTIFRTNSYVYRHLVTDYASEFMVFLKSAVLEQLKTIPSNIECVDGAFWVTPDGVFIELNVVAYKHSNEFTKLKLQNACRKALLMLSEKYNK